VWRCTFIQKRKSLLKVAARNLLRYWLPALLWTALVFIASTDAFSAEHTGPVLAFLVAKLVGPMDPANFAVLHALVRKNAHVTEYGILALVYLRAFRGDFDSVWRFLWARRALAACIAVAATDEFHQSFVASRGSSLWDVALDTAGATLCLTLAWIYLRSHVAQVGRAAPAA
jgi:VanZ family protein